MKKLALIKDVTNFWEIYEPMFKNKSLDVVTLDIFCYEDQQRLLNEEWDGFFWRAKHDPKFRDLAKRFISLFDTRLGKKTFPSFEDYWHYDDKMAQSLIFQKLNIPSPKTYIFYNKEEAIDFVEYKAKLPIIYKAISGAGSSNVGLLKTKSNAKRYIKKAFNKGIKTSSRENLQRYYVYFQEYLKDNDGDYRIVCYGKDIMLGFFRANRPKAKFASGSGIFDFREIPQDVLSFVYSVHEKLSFPIVMSYDVMKDNSGNLIITEISVIFGDLQTEEFYKKANYYHVVNGQFLKQANPKEVRQQLFVDSLLKKWGWIE